MHKHAGSVADQAQPGDAQLHLDLDFEAALVDLLASKDRAALLQAGCRLLQVMVPGSSPRVQDKTNPAPADTQMALPLDSTGAPNLLIDIPGEMQHDELQRRVKLVATLLAARDQQLQAMADLTENMQRTRRAEQVQRALFAIAELANSQTDTPAMFHAMHRIIAGLMYAENFYIVLLSDDGKHLHFPCFADTAEGCAPKVGQDYPLETFRHSPTWYLLHRPSALMGSMQDIARQVDGPVQFRGPDCVHWLGVPLLRDRRTVGAVVLQSYRDDIRYGEQDKFLLTYVAQQIQSTLQRHQAHLDLGKRVAIRTRALRQANQILKQQVRKRQRGERLQAALLRIAKLASNNLGLDAFYRDVHEVISGLLNADNFYIALRSADGRMLEFPYAVDRFDAHPPSRPLGNGLTEYVLRKGKPLLTTRANTRKLERQGVVNTQGAKSESWLGVPLVIQQQTIGVLAVQSYTPASGYNARDQELLTFVSYHIGNALERKRNADSLKQANTELEHRVLHRTRALAEANQHLRRQILKSERIEQRLKYQNLHDSLTGLPNRSLLLQRLHAALDALHKHDGPGFAVLFLDLDRFKVINDSVGHMVGDDLLFQAGGRIRACVKGHDVVARLGGDEFGVLLEQVDSVNEACSVASRIIDQLNRSFQLGTKELFTTTSIGIVMGDAHYRQADELLRDADTAMYRAKAAGRERYAVFDENMRKQATELQEIENDLRRAMTRDEFEAYFQPIVRLADDKIMGHEALMRWHHPRHGILPPKSFLRVAEDSGLDERIDWHMLEHILAIARDMTPDDRFISINLSARHFRASNNLHEDILGRLRRHDVQPGKIRIEITENVLLHNPERVRHTLHGLRAAGIGVALDDFGTGYSSLSYLHEFPLNVLKIDQSFVANLREDEDSSMPIVKAIMALADSQRIQVVAEGIESEPQARLLHQLGCEFGQGFLYGKPRPFTDWQRDTARPVA